LDAIFDGDARHALSLRDGMTGNEGCRGEESTLQALTLQCNAVNGAGRGRRCAGNVRRSLYVNLAFDISVIPNSNELSRFNDGLCLASRSRPGVGPAPAVTTAGGAVPGAPAGQGECKQLVTILMPNSIDVSEKPRYEVMSRNSYDPEALLERAAQWRARAAATVGEEERAFCLAEAEKCERRVQLSRSTPVFREKIGN
jgi:hypothetical protein